MKIDQKLKSCPFCGSSASTLRSRGFSVNCDGGVHECDVAPATTEFSSEAEAIAAWNRRAASVPADVADLVNRLRDEQDFGRSTSSTATPGRS